MCRLAPFFLQTHFKMLEIFFFVKFRTLGTFQIWEHKYGYVAPVPVSFWNNGLDNGLEFSFNSCYLYSAMPGKKRKVFKATHIALCYAAAFMLSSSEGLRSIVLSLNTFEVVADNSFDATFNPEHTAWQV